MMSFFSGAIGLIMLPVALFCFMFAVAIAIENPLGGAISLLILVLVAIWFKSIIKDVPQ